MLSALAAVAPGTDFDWQGGLYGLREFIGTIDQVPPDFVRR